MMSGRGLRWYGPRLLLQLLLFHTPQIFGQKIGQMRLTGGSRPYEGNLEVQVNGVWGYVCDDDFGFTAADLVCRDLGYSHAERFTRNNHFGDKSPGWRRREVKFWLDRSDCSLNDTSFRQCTFPGGVGAHDCGPTEIAGVVCATGEARCSDDEFACSAVTANVSCVLRDSVCDAESDCTDGSDEDPDMCEDVGVVRLKSNTQMNLPGAALGTVFVKHQQEWGTVCDDNFDLDDVRVICRSLGYEVGWMAKFTHAHLGEGTGPILLANLQCSGEEEWVGQCNSTDWFADLCFHFEDSGVFCYDGGLELRLAGGSRSNNGRVEVQVDGQWGSLCHNGFDDFDAQVVCRMLGYEGEAISYKDSHFGPGRGPVWDLVLDCRGNESNLQSCVVKFSDELCSHDTTAGVACSNSLGKVDEELRSALPSECGNPLDATHQFLGPLGKVSGGNVTTRFDAPWLAALFTKDPDQDVQICSATIISEDYLLTAAQCFDTHGRFNVYVRVGDYNFQHDEADQEDFLIDKLWIHEDYRAFSLDSDIALIKIERNYGRGISLSSRVKAACLPRVGDSYEDLSSCSVTGRGIIDVARVRLQPRQAQLKILNDEECKLRMGNNYTSSMVCAGNQNFINPCSVDQGGPLTCLVKDRHTLYGIISSTQNCGLFRGSDIYTRVTKFLRWIHNIIVNNKSLK